MTLRWFQHDAIITILAGIFCHCCIISDETANVKSIFHCKLGSHWVTNANEMSTNNMKWPKKFALATKRNLYSIGLRWGFALGETQISTLMLGVIQFFAFLDTNICRYPQREIDVGGLSQHQDPTQMILHRSGI